MARVCEHRETRDGSGGSPHFAIRSCRSRSAGRSLEAENHRVAEQLGGSVRWSELAVLATAHRASDPNHCSLSLHC
jgi:hypothetical protein